MTTNLLSKYYPNSGGQFRPVSTGQIKPVNGGQIKPVGTGQFEPDYANTDNPYDADGLQHYTLLNNYYIANSTSTLSSLTQMGFYNYCANLIDTTSFDLSALTIDSCGIFENENAYLEIDEFTDIVTKGDFQICDDIVNPILHIYFSNFSDFSNISDEVEYSITAENYICSAETLSATQRAQILLIMATTRYSIQYWNRELEGDDN